MGVPVISQKFYNQFTNAPDFHLTTDFTTALLACFGEKIKVVTQIGLNWQTVGVQYTNEVELSVRANDVLTIIRTNGSFLDDGFALNDKVDFLGGTNEVVGGIHYNPIVCSGTITFISEDGLQINITCTPGSYPWIVTSFTNHFNYYQFTLFGITDFRNLYYRFKAIPNGGLINFNSLTDNTIQEYVIQSITTSTQGYPNPKNPLSWVTDDSITVTFDSFDTTNKQQLFTITHIFRIAPLYLSSQLQDLLNGIQPDYFKTGLQYICEFEFREYLTQTNNVHIGNYPPVNVADPRKYFGNCVWLDKYFDGIISNEYSVTGISYSDSTGANCDSLLSKATTNFSIILHSVNSKFVSGTIYSLNFMFLPTTDFLANPNNKTIIQNYLFDCCVGSPDTGLASLNNILQNVNSSISGHDLTITGKTVFTSDQKKQILNGNYLIWVTTQDSTATVAYNSNRISLLVDLKTFTNNPDNPALLDSDFTEIYESPYDYLFNRNKAMGNYKGWNADDILIRHQFKIPLNAILNYLNVKFVCKNIITKKEFILNEQGLVFDCTSIPIKEYQPNSGTYYRPVNIVNTRGFNLYDRSLLNKSNLILTSLSGVIGHPTLAGYSLTFGAKLRWMGYLPLLGANTDFYDNSKLLNNLNQKWSNYASSDIVALLPNWKTYLIIEKGIADLQNNQTVFENISELEVEEFFKDESDEPKWILHQELFDGKDGVSLGIDNNAMLSVNNDTEIVQTYTPNTGILIPKDMSFYGVIRIEEYQKGGLTNIFELSTEEQPASNDPLNTITLTKTDDGTYITSIIVKCLLNKSYANPKSKYSLFGRMNNKQIGSYASGDSTTHSVYTSLNSYITDNAATISILIKDAGGSNVVNVTGVPFPNIALDGYNGNLFAEQLLSILQSNASPYLFNVVCLDKQPDRTFITIQITCQAPVIGTAYNGYTCLINLHDTNILGGYLTLTGQALNDKITLAGGTNP